MDDSATHPWWNSHLSSETNIYCISILSAIVTSFAGIGGLSTWGENGSVLMLGLGIINMVELLRNLILIWRFNRASNDTLETLVQNRDDKSSILITLVMFWVGVTIIILCGIDFKEGYQEIDAPSLISVSLPATIFFAFLGHIKMKYAPILKSSALTLDGLSSWLFALFSWLMLLSTLVIINNPAAWWLDPIIALILAFTCIFISIDVLYINVIQRGHPCLSFSYWSSDAIRHDRHFSFPTQDIFVV